MPQCSSIVFPHIVYPHARRVELLKNRHALHMSCRNRVHRTARLVRRVLAAVYYRPGVYSVAPAPRAAAAGCLGRVVLADGAGGGQRAAQQHGQHGQGNEGQDHQVVLGTMPAKLLQHPQKKGQ